MVPSEAEIVETISPKAYPKKMNIMQA